DVAPRDLRIGLARLVLLPDLLLVLQRGGGDGAEVAFVGHVALRHLVEHRRQHIGEQAKLANLADGLRQRDADRLLGPAERDEPFDGTPLIDRIERLMRQRLRERAYGAAILSAVNDKNRDLLKARGDGLLDAAM